MNNDRKFNCIVIGMTVLAILVMGVWWMIHPSGAVSDSESVTVEAGTEQTGLLRASVVEEVHTIDVSTLEDRFENMGFLITQEYFFKDVLTYKEAQKVGGLELPFTESSYMVTYEGTVTAGVDFSKIAVEKDDSEKTVTIVIPAAEIKNVDIDPDSMEVLDEKQSVFTTISVSEYNQSVSELEKRARSEAEEKGILTKADNNAKLVIENLVSEVLGDSDYTCTVEKQ